jgi:hypothetical protein
MHDKPKDHFNIGPAIRKLLNQHGPEYPTSKIRNELRILGYRFGRRHLDPTLSRLREEIRKSHAAKWKPVFEQVKERIGPHNWEDASLAERAEEAITQDG